MKMTDLRAKARAIFGSAIAEPMPKQPNGAKALQERANARPIPTYKVGGVVKKQNGGAPLPSGPTGDYLRKKYKEALDASNNVKTTKPKKGPERPGGSVARGPDITIKAPDSGRAKTTKPANPPARPSSGSPEADDVFITTRRGREMEAELRRREAMKKKAEEEKRARADKLLGIPAQKDGGKAGMYKKGGKSKDGLAVMIAIGEPMKGKSMKGMKKPVKRAVGGAGKTRKGMMK
jgi:hypothetical protein